MKRVVRISAIIAALAAGPVLADDGMTSASGSEQDPFSQTYNGLRPGSAEDNGQVKPDSKPCAQSCPCGHRGEKQGGQGHQPEKA